MNELLHYVDFCPCVCHQNLEYEFHALPYIYAYKFSQQSLSKTADVMGCLKEPTNACLQLLYSSHQFQ